MYELELLVGAQPGPRVRVGGRVLFLGRGRQCDLVLQDEGVSTRHLAIWYGDGHLFVEDLRSRNGTRVNGAALHGRGELQPGDLVELGLTTRLRVVETRPLGSEPPEGRLLVEDVESGAAFPLWKERFTLGGEHTADISIPGAPPIAAVLIVHATGEVWLGADAEDRLLRPDEEFVVSGRAFRLRAPEGEPGLTRELSAASYPYRLSARLDGPAGPSAVLSNRETGQIVEVRAETRAILLYLLGRKLRDDTRAGLPELERGWLTEAETAHGIWGRGGASGSAVNVLVFRARKDLEAGGFDPWCIEKRSRFLRLRVEEAEIDGRAGQSGEPGTR